MRCKGLWWWLPQFRLCAPHVTAASCVQIITCQQAKNNDHPATLGLQHLGNHHTRPTKREREGKTQETMIDHVLGRPSQKLKSVQVLLVVLTWTTYLARGNRHGPWLLRKLSRRLSNRLTAWQTFCMTLTGLYLIKNADKLLGLGGIPSPPSILNPLSLITLSNVAP